MSAKSKAAQLSTVDEGSEKLGRLLIAVFGPHWRPVGNGTYRETPRRPRKATRRKAA